MAWRSVYIGNSAKLSLADSKLVIRQDQEVRIPLEDIDTLILDNYAVTTTLNLLSELASNNIATIVCDKHHLPCGELLPLSQHSRQAKISKQQIEMSPTLRKQLWRRIVIQKIANQATALRYFDCNDAASQLDALSRQVKSGDTDNRESIAARIYFAQLLDDSTRRKPMWYNSALNYCYAIVRSIVARSIAARGLIPSQGLFHHSELNSFNLADDLIEPFRAACDIHVLDTVYTRHIGDERDANLTMDDRHAILDIINKCVIINNKKFEVRRAVEIVVDSLIDAIERDNTELLSLPQIS